MTEFDGIYERTERVCCGEGHLATHYMSKRGIIEGTYISRISARGWGLDFILSLCGQELAVSCINYSVTGYNHVVCGKGGATNFLDTTPLIEL
ncbi:MAG: hypothetical protein ACFFCW_16665 [Candidatus Hodarchaeota archaeon]